MENKIKEIVKILKKIRSQELPKLDDNTILEQSIDLFISDNINREKRQNIQSIQTDKKVSGNGSKQAIDSSKEPLTEKQKNFLVKNGYDGNMKLSKIEALKIIEEYINNQKGEKY